LDSKHNTESINYTKLVFSERIYLFKKIFSLEFLKFPLEIDQTGKKFLNFIFAKLKTKF